jgi:hypothetical protein
MPELLVRPAFLNYTPVPLAFGTSGLRGLVKDITDLDEISSSLAERHWKSWPNCCWKRKSSTDPHCKRF